MFCDECDKAIICEDREDWIYSEQFAQCEEMGKPDYCDDNHFIYANVKPESEEEDMANKKGTCTNCGRSGLNIANKEGHCHTCHKANKEVVEGEGKESALLAAKERLNDPGYKMAGLKSKPPTTEKVAKIKERVREMKGSTVHTSGHSIPDTNKSQVSMNADKPCSNIIIAFITDQDKNVRDYLEKISEQNRRTVPQQLLWMAECEMKGAKEAGI